MRIEELEGRRRATPMNVALYLRKSREDMEKERRGEEETLKRHEKILMDVVRRDGHNVIKIYREVVSGESIDSRPRMQELLKDLYENRYDGVLVVELERLARGATMDQGRVANAFKYTDTKIITPTKTLDPNNEMDEEWLEFSLFMSRREYKTIARRLNSGRLESIKEGNYLGSTAPFGYDIVKNKDGRTLTPNENSKYVKMIFEWFTEDGLTVGNIAHRLTDMGVPTKRGGEWHRGTIRDLLENWIYAGKIQWFKRRYVKGYDGEMFTTRCPRQEPSTQLLVEGKHPGIVSIETFEKARVLIDRGFAPVNASKEIKSPLATLVKCKKCGRAIKRQVYNTKKNCRPRLVHDYAVCKVKSAFYDDVIDAVVESLKLHVQDFEFKMTNDSEVAERKRKEQERDALMKELEALKKQKSKQFDLLEKGFYEEDEFIERQKEVKEKIKVVENRIKEIVLPEPTEYREKIIKFSEVIDALKDDEVSTRHKNALLKGIIKQIYYSRNEADDLVLDIILL